MSFFKKRNQFAKRVDKNHAEIKEVFKKAGWSVFDAKNIGQGFPDLIVGKHGSTFLVEIKTPTGKLTTPQREFMLNWKGGAVVILRTVEEALNFIKAVA